MGHVSTSRAPIDVVLIGGGIMSATLATLIQRLQPEWSIRIYERLSAVALESSGPWNNAGTGHSGLCELNYTPQAADGTVNVSKAIAVNEEFQQTRQFWSTLVGEGVIEDPKSFINPVPHMSFVQGEHDVDFLRRRWEGLHDQPLFRGMEFSDDPKTIAGWTPLLVNKRPRSDVFAATRTEGGADVDFGSLTKQLIDHAVDNGAELRLSHEVRRLHKRSDGNWDLRVKYLIGSTSHTATARFVFVGAGGWALKLLQRSGIPEVNGYGTFPVSGQFLMTDDPRIVAKHHAKVYSQAAVGAPPMSVPHLDTRVIDGKASLLFGPYAGANPKFLKKGSVLDLPGSVRGGNIVPYLSVAKDNMDLLRYLIGQLMTTRTGKLRALQAFVPTARREDWRLITAGQRAQIIKKDAKKGGVLQFGTEVVSSADGTIVGLLGASPGASTAVPIMLSVLRHCFPSRYEAWEPRLRELIPTLGETLNDQPEKAAAVMAETAKVLQLDTAS